VATNPAEIDWDPIVRCAPRVRLIASRLTADPDEAKDVVQETLIRLTSALGRYRRGNFNGWLYRVTRNVFLDRHRRRSRRRETPWSDVKLVRASPSNVVEDAADRADIQLAVRAAIIRLPKVLRAPIVLRDIQGLSYQEISTVLDISNGTVRSRIHRGRELLRVMLADFMRPDR
jgi:RNA polymerase sigma-70 factor (ECF subfamily)